MGKFKLTLKKGALFLVPFVLLGAVWFQSLPKDKNNLNPVLQNLAGPNAKDCSCSTMPLGEAKWKAMRDCAADAFQAKQPFWASEGYDVNGKGAAKGVALGQDGNYYQVTQAQSPWFSPSQTEITRGVGTKIIKHAQTGDRYIWSRGQVKVPNAP